VLCPGHVIVIEYRGVQLNVKIDPGSGVRGYQIPMEADRIIEGFTGSGDLMDQAGKRALRGNERAGADSG